MFLLSSTVFITLWESQFYSLCLSPCCWINWFSKKKVPRRCLPVHFFFSHKTRKLRVIERERVETLFGRKYILLLVIYCSMRWILLFIRMKRIYLIYIMMIIASSSFSTKAASVNTALTLLNEREIVNRSEENFYSRWNLCVLNFQRFHIATNLSWNQRCLMERHEHRFNEHSFLSFSSQPTVSLITNFPLCEISK